MSDNIDTPVVDGLEVAAKDIAGVLFPRNILTTSAGTDIDPATSTLQTSGNASLTAIAASLAGSLTVNSHAISNITGTITLPTGAATAAKQPALGTAGTASADVITVQGIASMTALKVDGSGVTQPVSGTFWQATQPVSGTFWQATQPVSIATLPTLAAGTNNIGDVDVLTINGVSPAFGTGVRSASVQRVTIATDDVVPVSQSGTWSLAANQSVNVAQLNGVTALMGNGATGTGSLRVTLANDSTGIGIVTETAPASDTASSGLNGRMQRVAQNVTTMSAKLPSALGATTKSASLSVTPATDAQYTIAGTEYETVAASQTAQALGATGATGDLINGILVIPATTSPGNVLLLDNATSITVFAGGATSVSNLVPFFIPLGIKSVSGAWKITTGANVSCIGIGDFT
jgi:hypothetical protein